MRRILCGAPVSVQEYNTQCSCKHKSFTHSCSCMSDIGTGSFFCFYCCCCYSCSCCSNRQVLARLRELCLREVGFQDIFQKTKVTALLVLRRNDMGAAPCRGD